MVIIRGCLRSRIKWAAACLPYAVTKWVNELYADNFALCYGNRVHRAPIF